MEKDYKGGFAWKNKNGQTYLQPKQRGSYRMIFRYMQPYIASIDARALILWDKILHHMGLKIRTASMCRPKPTYGIIDSQSVKTIVDSKQLVVNVMGNLLAVIVHAANIHDTKAGGSVKKIVYHAMKSSRYAVERNSPR